MKEFSGLGKLITVQIGRSISRWQGGTSYHITSSLTNIAQLCLLENIFPMGRKTGIFKGCGSHLKLQERWASVCLLLGKELLVDVFKFTSNLCSNGCKTCIWRVNVFCPFGSQQGISAFRNISNLPLKICFTVSNTSNLWQQNSSQVGH